MQQGKLWNKKMITEGVCGVGVLVAYCGYYLRYEDGFIFLRVAAVWVAAMVFWVALNYYRRT